MIALRNYLLALLVLLVAMQSFKGIPTTVPKAVLSGVDPAFVPYVQTFYNEAGKYNPAIKAYRVPISFVPSFPADQVGVCYHLGIINWIEISRNYWNNASPIERELVIIHELGHCVLNKRDEYPGIMSPYLLRPIKYIKNRDKLLKELFK